MTQRVTGSDTWAYIYDYANKLKSVEENGITKGEYVYDGDGKRIKVTENGETTIPIYSGHSIIYEENSTGTAAYVYEPASWQTR